MDKPQFSGTTFGCLILLFRMLSLRLFREILSEQQWPNYGRDPGGNGIFLTLSFQRILFDKEFHATGDARWDKIWSNNESVILSTLLPTMLLCAMLIGLAIILLTHPTARDVSSRKHAYMLYRIARSSKMFGMLRGKDYSPPTSFP
ncbi:hypothetical protein V2J09_018990 [Rumex salicifolius]